MCGWQVKLCDPLVTYGPYLSALEIKGLYIKRCINSSVYLLTYNYKTIIFLLSKDELVDLQHYQYIVNITNSTKNCIVIITLPAQYAHVSQNVVNSKVFRQS